MFGFTAFFPTVVAGLVVSILRVQTISGSVALQNTTVEKHMIK